MKTAKGKKKTATKRSTTKKPAEPFGVDFESEYRKEIEYLRSLASWVVSQHGDDPAICELCRHLLTQTKILDHFILEPAEQALKLIEIGRIAERIRTHEVAGKYLASGMAAENGSRNGRKRKQQQTTAKYRRIVLAYLKERDAGSKTSRVSHTEAIRRAALAYGKTTSKMAISEDTIKRAVRSHRITAKTGKKTLIDLQRRLSADKK